MNHSYESNLHDSVESAEQRVAEARAGVSAHYQAIEDRVAGVAHLGSLLGGALLAVLAVWYFVTGRAGRLQRAVRSGGPDAAAQLLQVGQYLLPAVGFLGALHSAKPAPRAIYVPSAAQTIETIEPARAGWFRQVWTLIKESVGAWSDDYAASMGAALSYYTLFSLAPLLIIVIAVAGIVFGQEAAQGEIVAQLRGMMGEEGAVAVEGMLKSVNEPAKGVVATVVGILTLLAGATAVFAELQSALDRIWRVPARKKESGIWTLLRTRLLSFGLVLGLGFLLLVSLVLSAALAALGKWWGGAFEGWEVLLEILNFVVSLAVITVLFAMIYKLMPRARIPWRDVWVGAGVTAFLFTIGKMLIGLYLGKSGVASGFGAAGALVLILVWVYYSAQIFLLGAEFTWVYARRHGSRTGQSEPQTPAEIPSRSGDAAPEPAAPARN